MDSPPLSLSRDELISDVLLRTPTHGGAKAGRPARTYIQQLCEDTGCCPEDMLEAMNDREKWRERVRDIRATKRTWWLWWWWWWYIYIYIYISIRTSYSLFLASLSDYILCPYRAVVDKFLLVGQYWRVHIKKCIEECPLWVPPCFSSSAPHVLFIFPILSIISLDILERIVSFFNLSIDKIKENGFELTKKRSRR